jgi:hypothetical protein
MRAGPLAGLFTTLLLGCNESAPTPPPVAAIKAPTQQSHTEASSTPHAAAPPVENRAVVRKVAPGEAPDVRYLPDDAFAAVVFNARRAFQSPALAALPYDEILAGSLEAWNFDPRDVEQWCLFFTPAVEGEPLLTPYSPAAVMRFIHPVDGRKLIATRGDFREATFGDTTYYLQTSAQPIAFYIPDDRTIVFAAEKQLLKMLAAKHSANPLAGRLANLDRNCDLQVLLNAEALTPALGGIAQYAGQQSSTAIVPYVNALRDMSIVTLTADLSGELVLTATVEARNPDAAARLHKLAKESRPLVQAGYSMFRGALIQAWRGEASQAVLDVTDAMMAKATVEYGETSLRLEIARPQRLDDLGRRLRMVMSP